MTVRRARTTIRRLASSDSIRLKWTLYLDFRVHLRVWGGCFSEGKNRMKVLITGGAGFIGSHLAEEHIKRGDGIYIIGDLSTGSMKNIERIKGLSNFHYYLDSVTNHQLMAELVDLSDAVYHLAAAVGVKLIVESPVKTI